MPKYKLVLEYDGTDLLGWQKQNEGPSVQGFLEEAILSFSGENAETVAAGRTDAGVHATGQVVHFEIKKDFPEYKVRDALNAYLKIRPIAVLKAEKVPDDFHARFSAVEKTYLYRIVNRRSPLALDRNRAWWVPVALNVEEMQKAANVLLGFHDFSSFRAAGCQANSPEKTLDELKVEKIGAEIRIVARARSFLYHQVRNMVGTLKNVGDGRWNSEDVYRILEEKDRTKAGPMAPAQGLYLTKVSYPE